MVIGWAYTLELSIGRNIFGFEYRLETFIRFKYRLEKFIEFEH